MVRDKVAQSRGHDPAFTWRTTEVLRIENLSDIVFALALGILVSANSAILTFSDLTGYLISIVPIAAGFAMLVLIWNDHFLFFRRYALADGRIIILNTALLLLILYIAYPLRFVFDSLFGFVLFLFGDVNRLVEMEVEYKQSGQILALFSAGYALVYTVVALMYGRVLEVASDLQLTRRETVLTRRMMAYHLVQVVIAVVTFNVALFTPMNGFAGFLFFFIGPGIWLAGKFMPLPPEESAPAEGANDA